MSSAFTVDVGRNGVLFSVEVAEETIRKVLVMRGGQPGVDQYHDMMRATSSATIMPVEMQKALQKQAQDNWRKENPDVMKELDGKGCSNRTTHARTSRMVYRRACFKDFGGQEWLCFIIALGGIDRRLIECAKQASTELVEARRRKLGDRWRAPETWQPGTAQRRQLAGERAASASSAGPLYNAVEHTLSLAKELRQKAKNLDKQIKKEQALYDGHKSNMSMAAWDSLLRRAELAWEEAIEASEKAGVEYKDRDGKTCCTRNQDDTWVGRTLTYYQTALRDES